MFSKTGNALPIPKYKINSLIDFVKYELINTSPDLLEGNCLLDFYNKVNTKTGELGTYINAFYKGLEFRIYEITGNTNYRRITVEGSLHKYWNNGAHNFNDFGIIEIDEVLKELEFNFNILSQNCVLRALEIGVNVMPPFKSKYVLNQCLLHKTDRLKWIYTNDEGNYIQARRQRHILKIYDKMTHYKNKGFDLDNEILRLEIKYMKMIYLNNRGIYTLSDLLKYGLGNFLTELLNEWQNVLIYDKSILDKTKYKDRYSNPSFWLNLNYDKFKYHRNKLNKFVDKNPGNIKNQIAILIKNKCESLNTKTPEINPLHIRLKTGVSTFQKQDENRRFCSVTGLNISMQKKDSILLSHTGLKYYYKTDRKVFEEIKRKHLTEIWRGADHKTQIKEIAHNIRTVLNNQRVKQTSLYTDNQLRMFSW